ncbi:binding--dependent transport system inner membrane component family protein, partial [Chlamydia psittaci 08-2626_L3]
FKNRRFE